MKLRTCLVLVLLVLVAGCIKYDQILTLNPDGSGQVSLHYAMTEALVQQMKAMQAMASQMTDQMGGEVKQEESNSMDALSFDETKITDEFKALKKEGFKLKSIKSYTKEGWQHMDVAFSFKDISRLKQVSFFKDSDMSIVRNDRGNYVISTKKKDDESEEASEDESPTTEGDETPSQGEGMEGMEQMMMPMFQGFAVSITIETPTEIIDTNAPEKDGKKAVWSFSMEKDPKAMEKMEDPDLYIEFKGKGVKLNELK